MADERIFKVKIDGLDKSYKDAVKLVDVLKLLEDVNTKVAVETNAYTKVTEESTNKAKEKTKALTEEEKAQKKLEQTKAKTASVDSEANREQIKATQKLRERTKEVQNLITIQDKGADSIAGMKAQLALWNQEWNNMEVDSEEFDDLTKKIDELNNKLKEAEARKGVFSRNVGNYQSATQAFSESIDQLSSNVQTMTTATGDMLNSLQSIAGATGTVNVESKEMQAVLGGLTKIFSVVTKLNKSYSASLAQTTTAQTATATATNATTVATKTFSKALISTGIGALVVGLGLLIANFKDVKKWLLEVYPPLEKLGDYFNEFKAIAMGVGNAIVEYITTPFKTVFAVVKGFMENGISGAIDAGKEAVKNGLNVIANYEKGYQKEKANQEKEAYLERLKLRQQELEDIIADNEAKLGSDWKYSKEAQKAYKELHEVKRELNADDLEETKKLERERMSYLREIRDRESQSAKDREAERKKEAERILALEKSLQDEKIKSIKDEEEREIETLKTATQRRLDEIKGNSQTEIDLRKQIADNAENEIEVIQKQYAEKREAKLADEKDKALADVQKRYDDEIKILDENLRKQDLVLLQSLEKQEITKEEYNSKMQSAIIDSLQKEIKIREKYGQSTTDLEIELSKIRIKQAEDEKDKVSKHFEDLHKSMQETINNIMGGITAIFDGVNAIIDSQLEDAQAKYEAISQKYDEVVAKREESDARLQELEDQAKNARGGRSIILQQQINDEMQANKKLADQEKQIAKEKEKQEKEIAKKEKQQKKAQIMSDIISGMANTALAITNALTVKPFPLGVVLASVAGAMGAVQVGVMSKQLAKLEDGGLLRGKRHSQGGMRVEGTNIEVEGGEYVINRESTSRNLGLIKYINSQRRELTPTDLSSFFSKPSQSFEPPFKRMFESGGQLPVINSSSSIDYEQMASAMKESLQDIKIEPRVAVTDINKAQDSRVTVQNLAGM